MNQLLNEKLTKIILDTMIFCEFSNEDVVDQDAAIALMEQVASELSNLSVENKENLINCIKQLLENYEGEKREFIQNFGNNFGLTI